MEPANVARLIDANMNQSQNRLLANLDNMIYTHLTSFQQSNDSQTAWSDVQGCKYWRDEHWHLKMSTEWKRRAIHRNLEEAGELTLKLQDTVNAVHGWKTVAEYEKNYLADNSNGEKSAW